jgi:acyl-CoA dehydrogenase
MTTLIITLAAVAVAWALAFTGAPLLAWTGVLGASLIAAAATGYLGPVGLGVLGLVFAAFAFFSIRPLRAAVATRPIFAAFKKVLPEMSSTEREALEAGDVWWEGEMFRGRPDWQQLHDFQATQLTEAEQAFLENEVETLCSMIDDWEIEFEQRAVPEPVMAYIRDNGFLAMLIPAEHGGLGFSAVAQSAVVTKIATKSIAVAVTVMVPNSLGPGELLVHYGTPEQQKKWLPGLVSGKEIPCFGLTGPEVGSDATAMPDNGVVCYDEIDGQRTLGIRLNFSKRWITLAPIATVVGLAFKLEDPDGLLGDRSKTEYGITCALVPADHPGVEVGRRHYPGSAFMNGTVTGRDVFIPIDWIIGGADKAGGGWRMLVECLSAGRGISLPALAAAAGQAAYRMTGAYGRIRRQFKLAIGKFEGVQEASGRIAGLTYTLESMRLLTASGVDHCTPSVVTAVAKYHMTEMMRRIIIDAMDIHSGRGVQQGPRNYLAAGYKAAPIAITVEGANIMTRNLMIFGQGAIRCHPHVFPEMEAARADDLSAFDRELWSHIGYSVNRGVRAFTLGLTGAKLARAPEAGPLSDYYRQLERMSASLAFVSDVTMGMLGGDLKRKERLSARLGDVLSQLYIASGVLWYFRHHGSREDHVTHARWALDNCLAEIHKAFDGFFANFPSRPMAGLMRTMVFPWGRPYREPSDALTGEIAESLMAPSRLRDELTQLVYVNGGKEDPIGRIEHTFELLIKAEEPYLKYFKALSAGELDGHTPEKKLADAVSKGVLSAEERDLVAEYDAARYDAIQTDDFPASYFAQFAGTTSHEEVEEEQRQVA